MDGSEDPLVAVRRLAEARRVRDPEDQIARLLLATLGAADHLRGIDPAEARRRVDAVVRVLGVVAPSATSRTDPVPRSPIPGSLQPDSKSGRREPSTAAAQRTAAETRLPDDAIGPRSRPHARPGPDLDAQRTPQPVTRGVGRTAEERTRPAGAGRPEEVPTPVDALSPPLLSAQPGTRGARGPAGSGDGQRRPEGRPPSGHVTAGLSELARAWAELGRGALPSEPVELLAELVRTGVPEGAEAVRFHLALLRGVDLALSAARYLPCEAAIVERGLPLLRAAAEGAERHGVRLNPPVVPGSPAAACAVQSVPAFGEPAGAVMWVDQHGFALPDGRAEPAQIRVAAGPAAPWFEALTDGYEALMRAAAAQPEGPAQVRAYRAWLDELPGIADAERRATTLRYAASALFAVADADPAARGAFERLAYALEREGSYVIPLEPAELSDARRYELVLRPGVGPPRVVRPGFQGAGVVQQRARILADPAWLGTMSG